MDANSSSVSNTAQLRVLGEKTAPLISLEAMKNIPFEIRRVYYIFGTAPGVIRGRHAHRKLRQLLICVSGSCVVTLDNGREKMDHLMNGPEKGLYIGESVWREMRELSPDCVILVLASEYYDEADYIRDYDEFKRHTGTR